MTNEPVWTEWLENPGTGESPVPEFAVKVEMILADGDTEDCEPKSCFWESDAMLPVTHYRYAVPADLAWLAENVNEWIVSDRDSIRVDWVNEGGRKKSWAYTNSEFCLCQHWHYDQWLRARRDLGYEQAGGIEDEPGDGDYWEREEDDPVNHPSHYMLAPELEAIDVIRAALTPTEYMGYLKGSILKYRLRAGRKGEAEQDIAKSDWYRGRALEIEQEGGA